MMKKYRGLALSLVLIMGLGFAACGEKPPASADEVKGEIYDTGVFTVMVPEGWLAVPGSDLFDEYEGDSDPTTVGIYKGAKNELDAYSTPGVTIIWNDPDKELIDPSLLYDNVEKLDPVTTGSYTWDAFQGESIGSPIAVLTTESPAVLQANLYLENGGKKISLEDAEVQAILGSITVK